MSEDALATLWPLRRNGHFGHDLFGRAVAATLRPASSDTETQFAILANYPFNHDGAVFDTPASLVLGEIAATTAVVGSSVSVEWHQADRSSGQHISASMTCSERSGTFGLDMWEISTTWQQGQFQASGVVAGPEGDASEVVLTVGATPWSLGSARPGRLVTADAVLMAAGVGPAQRAGEEFALLRDFQTFEPSVRFVRSESVQISTTCGLVACTGFVLTGEHTVPSYWWVDEDGRVVAMSNEMWTLIRSAREVQR